MPQCNPKIIPIHDYIGQECSGPRSKHSAVVSSTLDPKAGHGLDPVLMVSSVKEQKILSLVIRHALGKYICRYILSC